MPTLDQYLESKGIVTQDLIPGFERNGTLEIEDRKYLFQSYNGSQLLVKTSEKLDKLPRIELHITSGNDDSERNPLTNLKFFVARTVVNGYNFDRIKVKSPLAVYEYALKYNFRGYFESTAEVDLFFEAVREYDRRLQQPDYQELAKQINKFTGSNLRTIR